MPDSAFITAFNHGNNAFKQAKGEAITVLEHGASPQRTITAVEVATLTAQEIAAAGGKLADNTVVLYILKEELGDLAEGRKIVVRGKRLRVGPTSDDGDNIIRIEAVPAGVKL